MLSSYVRLFTINESVLQKLGYSINGDVCLVVMAYCIKSVLYTLCNTWSKVLNFFCLFINSNECLNELMKMKEINV